MDFQPDVVEALPGPQGEEAGLGMDTATADKLTPPQGLGGVGRLLRTGCSSQTCMSWHARSNLPVDPRSLSSGQSSFCLRRNTSAGALSACNRLPEGPLHFDNLS